MIYLVFVSSLSVKLRELNFSLFVYFVGKACLFFNFCMMEFTTMFCLTWLWIIQKLKNKHTFPKKYTNWAKLSSLNLTEREETKSRYFSLRKHLGFITDSRHLREFATKTFFPNEIVFSSSDGLKSDTTHI